MSKKTKNDLEKDKNERIGIELINNQGSLMKIVNYFNTQNIIIEFQDKYKYTKKTTWSKFCKGEPTNPYHPTVFDIGIKGLLSKKENKKEYDTWYSMLSRCYDKKYKEEHHTYQNVTCCEEWLLFENFYEWIHKQENFDKWLNGKQWNLDKDILVKGNKIYSPNTCCLVPHNINILFIKKDIDRNGLPIGVCYNKLNNNYLATCSNSLKSKTNRYIGSFSTPEDAFYAYKKEKEHSIKQMAQQEYKNGNIIKKCYEAMMNYQVEITD